MQGSLDTLESGMKGWMWDRESGGMIAGEFQQPVGAVVLLMLESTPNIQFSAGVGLHK